jgi:type VI secretion system secreted protein VgrG
MSTRLCRLSIDGSNCRWLVDHVQGTESLCAPFWFEVWCAPAVAAAERGNPAFAASLLTKDAELSWPLDPADDSGADASGDGRRKIKGIVQEVSVTTGGWWVVIVPKVSVMSDAVGHRIFVDKTTLEIAKSVLEDYGLSADDRCARKPPPRAHTVQPFEDDLSFASRILAEDGIVWFVDPDQPANVVLVDRPSGFRPGPTQPIVVRDSAGMVTETHVHQASLSRSVSTNKVSLRDYDFENPPAVQSLRVDASTGDGHLERFEYRGHYTDPAVGRTLAQLRLEQYRNAACVLQARTNSRAIRAGDVVTLTGGSLASAAPSRATGSAHSSAGGVNGASDWIVVSAEHATHDVERNEPTYTCDFVAVPAVGGYRPPRPDATKLGGVQTVDVTGPAGAEIHPDEYGRIKMRHRWDRHSPADDSASGFCRVLQPPTSGGFLQPRVGWEELAAFWGASADEPMMLGRLYTGHATPPQGLPGRKVVTTFGTSTTPGGGSVNHFTMDDTAGSEGMHFGASKDFNERTENDKVVNVTANDTHKVGGNRTVTVGEVLGTKVGGSQTCSVGGSRTVNVNANKAINAGSESVHIGAARIFDVGGDSITQCAKLGRVVGGAKAEVCVQSHGRVVTGASSVVIGASWTEIGGLSCAVSVGGVNKEEVGGAKNVKALAYGIGVKGLCKESYGSRSQTASTDIIDDFKTTATYDVSGSATFKGADVIVAATDKITIKAGGMTVTITSGDVTIDGKFDSSQASVDTCSEDYD